MNYRNIFAVLFSMSLNNLNGAKLEAEEIKHLFPLTCILYQSEGMIHAYLYLSNLSNFH